MGAAKPNDYRLLGLCKLPLIERLEAQIEPEPNTGCWLWTGSVSVKGYGITTISRRLTRAHRVLYEMKYGPVPKGLELDHLCRQPCCVNPDHLEAVTHSVNVLRGIPFRRPMQKPRRCMARLWHGPGHQSSAQCERPSGNHKVHRCTYGKYEQRCEWRSREAATGYFDEPEGVHELHPSGKEKA